MKTFLATIATVTMLSTIAQAHTYKCLGLDNQVLTSVELAENDTKVIGTYKGAKVRMTSSAKFIVLTILKDQEMSVVTVNSGSNFSYGTVSSHQSSSIDCISAK